MDSGFFLEEEMEGKYLKLKQEKPCRIICFAVKGKKEYDLLLDHVGEQNKRGESFVTQK